MQKQKEKSVMSVLMGYAGGHKWLTYLGMFLSGVSAVMVMAPVICIWFAVKEIFAALPDVSQAKNLTTYGWLAVAFAIGSMLIYFIALMCTHISAFRTAKNLRMSALKHVLNLPLGYFNTIGSGKLRRIIDESSGQTESFLAHQLPDLVGAIVTPIATIVLLFVFDWRLGMISLAPTLISVFFLHQMMGASLAEGMKNYQNALEDMNNEAVEYVRGVPVVKTFGQSVFSFKKFHVSIKRYRDWAVNYSLKLRLPNTCYTVAVNAVSAFIAVGGAWMIASAVDYKAFLLDLIFYILFTPICVTMMNKLMWTSENTMLAQDAVRRINTVLEEKPIKEPVNPQMPKDYSVSFENVTFTYPKGTVSALNNLSFSIPQGSTVALVGPSGGGKTTAASLIPRFWDTDTGCVKIGGVDVKNISVEELMNHISFVFQQSDLFKTTLLENIRESKPNATEAEVMAAVKAASCEDIIDKMPDGLHTVVGTKGVYLSGGEKQRIALARAILKDAPIILLDEATAFADPENEVQIQRAFEELTKGKTVLMIAHRLSTIKNADNIIVLADGSIQEQGKHNQLLEKNGIYKRMWNEYMTSISWKVGKEDAHHD